MTRTKGREETANRIIESLGGTAGLSRLNAYRLETLTDGIIFNVGERELLAVVIIRQVPRGYRVHVHHVQPGSGWFEVEGVAPRALRIALRKMLRMAVTA